MVDPVDWVAAIAGMVGGLMVLMAMGLPVAFAFLVVGGVASLLVFPDGVGLTLLARTMVAGLRQFVLVPIPLFLLIGNILLEGGGARRARGAPCPPDRRRAPRLAWLRTRSWASGSTAACPQRARRLGEFMASFEAVPDGARRARIAGGLEPPARERQDLAIEATLSQSSAAGLPCYTLIFRDVNQRLEAERRIAKLKQQTGYLQAEIKAFEGGGELIGRSDDTRQALAATEQVAATDATVLLFGESGTTKELFARDPRAEPPQRGAGDQGQVRCDPRPSWSRAGSSATRRAPSPARPYAARAASG